MKHEPVHNKEGFPRRSFLAYSAAAAVAFIAAVFGLVGAGTVLSPALKGKKEGTWVSLGNLSQYTQGEPRKADLTLVVSDGWLETSAAKSVWVVAHSQEKYTVFNGRCTHLGCAYSWEKGSKGTAFYCPCHAGIFAIDGKVLGGPPPRPLDTLQWKIEDGNLWCRYLDFIVGIPDKKPA